MDTVTRFGHAGDLEWTLRPVATTSLERKTASRVGMDNGVARTLKQVMAGKLDSGRRSTYTLSTLG